MSKLVGRCLGLCGMGAVIVGMGAIIVACSSSGGESGSCSGDTCVQVLRGFYSTEPCTSDPSKMCNYANAHLTVRHAGANVRDLTAADASMTIKGRSVGVEGEKALASSKGMVVSFLLDTSYSITQAGAEAAVAKAAKQFVDQLPNEALIMVALFASEPTVPILACADGSTGTSSARYASKAEAKSIIDTLYKSHKTLTSEAQTKIFDAVTRLSTFRPGSASGLLLPRVQILFTDGADSASTKFTSAKVAREKVTAQDAELSVYAVGLGAEVDKTALDTLSQQRTFLAVDAAQLDAAFKQVADELAAIFHLRILVATIENGALAELKITYKGQTVASKFVMSSTQPVTGRDGGGGGGGAGANWTSCSVDADCISNWCGCNSGTTKQCLPNTSYPKDCNSGPLCK